MGQADEKRTQQSQGGWKENWRTLAACGGLPLVLEGLLHLFVYGEISGRFFYPCMFALAAGCLLWIASTLFEERVNKVVFLTLSSLITVYFEIQFVYNSIFGEFMSFWQFSFGAEAVANFWQQMLYGIWEALPGSCCCCCPRRRCLSWCSGVSGASGFPGAAGRCG